MKLILTNVNIFTVEGKFEKGVVICESDIIKDVLLNCTEVFNNAIDCQDAYLIPGLTDIHFHGCVGHDFCDADDEGLNEIAKYQLKNGITQICPATMTYSEEILSDVMRTASDYKCPFGSDLVGINMEGPFINLNRVGGQNPKYVQKADGKMIDRLNDLSGNLIKLIDIAPEVEGSLDFIKSYCNKYSISIAHTDTTYDNAMLAYELGAKHLTHCFNAMPSIHHRNPGPILAAADNDNINIEIICDGQHIHYSAIRMIFKLFGKDRVCLISDSCEATGAAPGFYKLGGQSIYKKDGKAVLADNPGVIAASTTNLYQCMRHAILDAKIKPEYAVLAATINPCRAIGVDDMYGSIEAGKKANFILVDNNWDIIDIYFNGNRIDR